MSARWIRIPPEPRHDVAAAVVAGAVALGVGLAAFYLTRLLLAREPLPGEGPEGPEPGPHGGTGGAT